MSYDVILRDVGRSKLGVIKTIIDLTGLGLKDSKDLADSVDPNGKGRVIRRTDSISEAESIKNALHEAGARAEIMNNTTLEIVQTSGALIDLKFRVVSTGSIIQVETTTPGLIGITGKTGPIGLEGNSSFRINYRSKDGEDKSETIEAPTLEIAKTKILDLDYVNYHMGG